MTRTLGQPCWTIADARAVLFNEALGGDDAVFLATHTPVQEFALLAGSHNAEIEDKTERSLLDAISAPDQTHVLCVIQGAPGSGKSHLIRWLQLHWHTPSDLTLLVRRSNGSLAGALAQLRESLKDYSELFDGLGAPQTASLHGRAALFLTNLGAMLQPNHYESRPDDADWCGENDASALILNKYVREHWDGPERILTLLDGGEERNSQSARFHLGDIAALAAESHEIPESRPARRLAKQLVEEARAISDLLEEGYEDDELLGAVGNQAPQSVALLNALNARLNDAIRNVLGVSPTGLKRLFDGVRAALAKDKRRLVLLLEDITSVQGVDDALIDVLITEANSVKDQALCPLISVIGVTPEYYGALKDNYRQRITHNIDLGDRSHGSEYAAALRSPEARTRFVARYLSAVRAGPKPLDAWHRKLAENVTLAPPNSCRDCPIKAPCHQAFGETNQVGLFPFTPEALEIFFHQLKDDGVHRHKTPRGMLQGVLNPSLFSADRLTHGAYPGPQIETEALEAPPIIGELRERIAQSAEDGAEQERLRILMAYWGDRRVRATRDARGNECFAGVPKAVSDAFDLPWLGGESHIIDLAPAPAPDLAHEPEEIEYPEVDETDEPPTETRARQPQTRSARDARPPPRRRAPRKSEIEQLRTEIAAFRDGSELTDISNWNNRLYEAVIGLDPLRLGIERYTFDKFFTPANVKIAGAGAERQNHFVVERELWLLDGLEATASLRLSKFLDPADILGYRRKAAGLRRKLEPLAAEHVAKRLKSADPNTLWSPTAAAVQVLLARAWLQGKVSPDATDGEQWVALLSDEDGAETDPKTRTNPWGVLLDATKSTHARMREALREMVSLPQGEAESFGLANTSAAALALRDLKRMLRFAPSLDQNAPSLGTSTPLQFVRAAQEVLRDQLPQIPRLERKRVESRFQELVERLHGWAIEARLDAVETEINRASGVLGPFASQKIKEWKGELRRVREGLDAPAIEKLEELALNLPPATIEDGSPRPPVQDLALLISVPAKPLEHIVALLEQGDALMAQISDHLGDIVSSANNAPDLDVVRRRGEAFTAAAAAARALIKGDST